MGINIRAARVSFDWKTFLTDFYKEYTCVQMKQELVAPSRIKVKDAVACTESNLLGHHRKLVIFLLKRISWHIVNEQILLIILLESHDDCVGLVSQC
jgi:hypothetical protein